MNIEKFIRTARPHRHPEFTKDLKMRRPQPLGTGSEWGRSSHFEILRKLRMTVGKVRSHSIFTGTPGWAGTRSICRSTIGERNHQELSS